MCGFFHLITNCPRADLGCSGREVAHHPTREEDPFHVDEDRRAVVRIRFQGRVLASNDLLRPARQDFRAGLGEGAGGHQAPTRRQSRTCRDREAGRGQGRVRRAPACARAGPGRRPR